MPIVFDGVTLTKAAIADEVFNPSCQLTIECRGVSLTDISNIDAKTSTIISKAVLTNKQVRLQGDGSKGSLVMSTFTTRTIANMMIWDMRVRHDAGYVNHDITLVFVQDTTT